MGYLEKLVAMPTVSSNLAANNAALDYIQAELNHHELYVKRYEFNGYGALVATTSKDTRTPKVLLAAHLDVVPGPDSVFTLREADSKYFGRGVFDMKFAIASYLEMLQALQGDLRDYDFGIMLTTDEEEGGLNGVKPLVELGYKPQVVVLPDGASNWQIETFAKGFILGSISTSGKSAHGSRPWEGDSASFKLVNLLHELQAFFSGQTHSTNTLNISKLEAGEAKTQIPALAKAFVDIRFMSNTERDKIIHFIDMLCHKYDATLAIEPLEGHPCMNELTNPLIKTFADCVTATTGQEVSGTISYGASDARFFAGINVPAIICRPPGGGQHADDEWIDKRGYEQYSQILVDFLHKVARR